MRNKIREELNKMVGFNPDEDTTDDGDINKAVTAILQAIRDEVVSVEGLAETIKQVIKESGGFPKVDALATAIHKAVYGEKNV